MIIIRDADAATVPLVKTILACAPLETEVGKGQHLPDGEGLV